MMLVRAELCERLEALRHYSKRQQQDFTTSMRGIRQMAAAYGLDPVVRVAEAMERAMAENPQSQSARLYLDRLHDAIGCTRTDEAASEAMIASVSVRLGR